MKSPLILALSDQHDFAGKLQTSLAESALTLCGLESGIQLPTREHHTRLTWPNGESYDSFQTDPQNRDVIIVGALHTDAALMQMFELAYAVQKYGCRSLNLVVPFFGYGTMERANPQKGFEVVKAKTRARILSAIPAATCGNNLFVMDLHTDMTHYFEGALRCHHLYSKDLLFSHLDTLLANSPKPYVLASPDAGRAKWVESLAKDLGWPAAIALKDRVSGSEVTNLAVTPIPDGCTIVLFDDMIRSGSTLKAAAKAFTNAGAAAVIAIASHGDFCGNAPADLMLRGISQVLTSNSHPKTVTVSTPHYYTFDCAPVFGTALANLLYSS
jgi:ribose-phosphate pyrophosphokinase